VSRRLNLRVPLRFRWNLARPLDDLMRPVLRRFVLGVPHGTTQDAVPVHWLARSYFTPNPSPGVPAQLILIEHLLCRTIQLHTPGPRRNSALDWPSPQPGRTSHNTQAAHPPDPRDTTPLPGSPKVHIVPPYIAYDRSSKWQPVEPQATISPDFRNREDQATHTHLTPVHISANAECKALHDMSRRTPNVRKIDNEALGDINSKTSGGCLKVTSTRSQPSAQSSQTRFCPPSPFRGMAGRAFMNRLQLL
jgi:hypothetical protein